MGSDQGFSGVAQTANIGSATSVSSGAAKIFREFKWGLLTLFILMAVVVCLVYDGGRNKKHGDVAQTKPGSGADSSLAGLDASPNADTPGTTPGGSTTPGGTTTPAGNVDTADNGDEDRPEHTDVWHRNPVTPGTRPGANPGPAGGGTANGPSRPRSNHIPEPGGDTAAAPQPNEPSPHGVRQGLRPSETHETPQHAEHSANAGFKTYVVKSGDSLSKIASENLPGKGGLKAITEANKDVLPDINRLREGMKLKIPNAIPSAPAGEIAGKTGTDRNSSRQETSRSEPNRQATGSERRGPQDSILTQDDYVVQSGDSLERIARKVLNDPRKWKDLMEWNKDRVSDESKLKVGTVLRTHAPNANIAPVGTDGFRARRNTIRAEAEYPPEDNTESDHLPNAEVVPISPVAANSKAPAVQKTEKGASTKHSDAPAKGEILPAD